MLLYRKVEIKVCTTIYKENLQLVSKMTHGSNPHYLTHSSAGGDQPFCEQMHFC